MAHYRVGNAQLEGSIRLPSSKSHTLRAILFGSLGKGKTLVNNCLSSPDTQAMIEACRLWGAEIHTNSSSVEIKGVGGRIHRAEDVIQAGNSGIVLRFCTAIGALAAHPVVVTGDHSIRHNRPMKPLLEGLMQLGVKTATMRGDSYAPVIVQGPLRSGKAVIEGADSQPVSALLIASAFAEGPIELEVVNPGEKPWVALTLDWFRRLGITYAHCDFCHYTISGNTSYEGFSYQVPGDHSSAAFPLVAALITNSELQIDNLDMRDPQGDKELISVLQQMGAKIEIDHQQQKLVVKKGSQLIGRSININNFIDTLTILAVVGCFAEGETRITHATIAKQKECNRISCVVAELRKMGANISETEDGLLIRKSSLRGALVDSHQDHRMAMSLAVAALAAKGETAVQHTSCVAKTFPTFVSDFNKLGANIEELK